MSEIRRKTVSIADYMISLDEPFKEKFLTHKQAYQPNRETIGKLKAVSGGYAIVVFSAAWCKDCATNMPVLAIINETTGLEIRVFGGLKRDPLSQKHRWRVPPSPPEVEAFNVEKIPLMIIADREGREIGRIVEKPAQQPTLEQEIYEIIKTEI